MRRLSLRCILFHHVIASARHRVHTTLRPMTCAAKKDGEQVVVRHADASGGDIIENQHEEDRLRYIHVGKRGSEATSEEQSDEWRETERLEHEAPNTSASSDPCVALENLESGEIQRRPGSVLVRKSGHVDDDVRIYALDAFPRDGCTKESLHRRSVGKVSRRRCRRSQEVN